MNYEKPKKRRTCLVMALLLTPFLVAVAVFAAISLNLIREGKPGLLSKPTQEPEVEKTYTIDTSSALTLDNNIKIYALLGSDFRPESGYRTDVILLAAVNLKESKVNLLSIPRDLWVTIPGFGEQRINTVQPYGGFELFADTLMVNFGFRPDHYAMVDFDGFKQIIDLLGGIDVNVSQALEDQCEFNAQRWCRVEPGSVTMNGDYALWYVRSRYTTSDFDRTRRAQEVIQAMARKAVSFSSLTNISQLIGSFQQTVETDMVVKDLSPLLWRFGKLTKDEAITSYTIGPDQTTGWFTEGGADVLLPNYELITPIIQKFLWIDTP